MTLAEIREKYGVPAEVGMRVSFIHPGDKCRYDGKICAATSVARMCRQCLRVETEIGNFEVPVLMLTYYADDSAVLWEPGMEKSDEH